MVIGSKHSVKLKHTGWEVTGSIEVDVLEVDFASVWVILWIVLKIDEIFVRHVS